ncbi:allantoicase [Streptomyces sp. NPDC056165]|uniref:allantoicase n=1 Tax=Streptomyces sp. NPDC056165 TaxID=3345733 RepID=UPI0035DDF795
MIDTYANGGLEFERFPDLALRSLGGSVTHANDELFAERENLIKPEPSRLLTSFGNKGGHYDGWETRRRRGPGHDYAVVRLGVPGVIHGVVIDTAHFLGNYPPYVSVEATSVAGYPSPPELDNAEWVTIVAKTEAKGGVANGYACTDPQSYTHVRLSIYPDGGVARFRVHGEPVVDPRFLHGTLDLASLENGGRVVNCSDTFYSSPTNILLPDRARDMGEGWETSRRRDDGNDFAVVRLAGAGEVRHVEVDTSYFVGNAPGWIRLLGAQVAESRSTPENWFELVPRTRVCPDTRHRFLTNGSAPVTHVRLDIYPDGGLARLRVHGELTAAARAAATTHWFNTLPQSHARLVLAGCGVDAADAAHAVSERPYATPQTLADSFEDMLPALIGQPRPPVSDPSKQD